MNLRNNRKTVSLGVGKQLAVMQHLIILVKDLHPFAAGEHVFPELPDAGLLPV